MEQRELEDAVAKLMSGRITRRAFMARALAAGLTVSAAGAIIAACSSQPDKSVAPSGATGAEGFPVSGPVGEGSGGTLILGQESDMDVLDPALGVGAVTWRTVLYQVYESLATRELNNPEGISGKIIPNITDSIDQASDGTAYTFHLHPGINFTDGTPFDAEAVKWNVERQWDQSSLGRTNPDQFDPNAAGVRAWFWGPSKLKDIVVVDPNTVRFELGGPFSEFVGGMIEAGLGTMGISSPAIWQKYGTPGIAEHPTGTGPFVFDSRAQGEHVTITKNPNYWDPSRAAKLDKIIFKVLPDVATRVQALRAGEVHGIFAPPPSELATLQKAGFIVTARVNPHLWYLSLNALEPYWADQRVREAFWSSIDREGMANNLLKGTSVAAINMTGRTSAAYSDKVRYPDYDPEKAKQLLKDAGFANGFDTVFQIPTGGSGEVLPVPMAEWIADNASKVGIRVKLETSEWITYLHDWGGGMKAGIGLNQMSWGMTSPYWLNLPLRSNGFNVGHTEIDGMDALLDAGNQALNPQTAAESYQLADALNGRQLWALPIINDLAPVVLSPKVMNFVHTPDWWWDYRNIWVKS
jgi:peptide/nickel transport system substrate-binding protein